MRTALLTASLALALDGCASTTPVVREPGMTRPHGLEIANATVLFAGGFEQGRQPDGNSIVIDAPAGMVVFDTGRHREHTQRLADHAHAIGKPVAAIVNSHWHLDHSSGNRLLRESWPDARVYSGDAAKGALVGFLADSRRQAQELIAKNAIPEPQLSDVLGDLATIAEGRWLLPTETIAASGERLIAGRRLYLGLAEHAVTAADVWLYDPSTRVLLASDLVTLPAPLFDTACAAGWSDALRGLGAMGFERLVPGHGATMDRTGFDRYRNAFDGLLACAASDASVDACSDRWLADVGDLVGDDQHAQARSLLGYYLPQVLRAPAARRQRDCPR